MALVVRAPKPCGISQILSTLSTLVNRYEDNDSHFSEICCYISIIFCRSCCPSFIGYASCDLRTQKKAKYTNSEAMEQSNICLIYVNPDIPYSLHSASSYMNNHPLDVFLRKAVNSSFWLNAVGCRTLADEVHRL